MNLKKLFEDTLSTYNSRGHSQFDMGSTLSGHHKLSNEEVDNKRSELRKSVISQLDNSYSGNVTLPLWIDASYELHAEFRNGNLIRSSYTKEGSPFNSQTEENFWNDDFYDIRNGLDALKILAQRAIESDIIEKFDLANHLKALSDAGWNLEDLENTTIHHKKFRQVDIDLGALISSI